MAFCGKCGKQLEDNVQFCPGCGASTEIPANDQQPAADQSKLSALNNTADSTEIFAKEDIEKNKIMGVLAYILFLIPLLAAKESPFARYHTNQGLVLFIGAILSSVITIIPILGWIIAPILSIVVTVLAIIGIVNALNGKAKELPIVGKFRILK